MDLEPGAPSTSKLLVPQTHEIIIPSYSAWFHMAKINDVEKKSLPEFFNNCNKSKTPSIYKDYRDFMINTYRLNPSEYLTVTACRRNLAGDVCAITRVHAFLEQWGLINYQVDPDSRPSGVGPAFTGHFRVTADTPRGLQPIYPAVPLIRSAPDSVGKVANGRPQIDTAANVADGKSSAANVAVAPLRFSKDIYSDAAKQVSRKHSLDADQETGHSVAQPPQKKAKHNCSTCGVDCSRIRYHSLKTSSMEICPNCYIEGRFPSTMYSGDFLKMDDTGPAKHASTDDWTEQETLLLLEGLELFDEDWNKVSDHVGTRTREQCITKFLQLPIEDPYVGVPANDLGPLQYHRIPLSAVDNPVLSLTAFLASVVDPQVASAAAKAAVQEVQKKGNSGPLTRQPQPVVKSEQTGNAVENGNETSAVAELGKGTQESKQTGDAMDVDPPREPASTTVDEKVAAPEAASKDTEADVTEVNAPSATTLQKAAATAIGSAAAKAHVLGVNHATSELHALTLALLQAQYKKLEAKMSHFAELEAVLESERKEIEREKQKLYADRLAFRKLVHTWDARDKENMRAMSAGHHGHQQQHHHNIPQHHVPTLISPTHAGIPDSFSARRDSIKSATPTSATHRGSMSGAWEVPKGRTYEDIVPSSDVVPVKVDAHEPGSTTEMEGEAASGFQDEEAGAQPVVPPKDGDSFLISIG
ncbi:SWIRM domain-containing protein [Fimicolochytrium jonesii]|uniref:SWIRM domain-containing protein n=1 Tax=Fimicolochytrium jonesii TaxID=1396493 RepID=UPI0022FEE07E|nr:SWIRM domain-containing protein [Fimicolochytrium jonesii]KAI8820763.1 SWIRM domain-containing protein [Fimicolochytrium jonesii]